MGKTNLINVFFGREFIEHSEATSKSYNSEGELNHKKNLINILFGIHAEWKHIDQ